MRILVVAGIACLLVAVAFFSYRWYVRPTTLTIAVGSQDGDAPRLVSAIAARLAQTNASVRLNVKETSSALDAANAFSSGKADLAVVRGDVGDLSNARAVIVASHAVVLLVAPPGSPIDDLAGLKRSSIGVIGGEINRKIVDILTTAYDLQRANVTFRYLTQAEARHALQTKEVSLLLVAIPVTEKYLALLRGLFPQAHKTAAPVLVPIEIAGAIAEKERAYESFDLPKGTLRSSPPAPEEDLTTLRVTFYLVAKRELDKDLVFQLTEALINARHDLLDQWPMLASIAAPDTDPDAFLTVHPGAADFYNGNQVAFLDKWGNLIFLIPMLLGGLASAIAAARSFLREPKTDADGDPLDYLYALSKRIRTASDDQALDNIEDEIDRILRSQRADNPTNPEEAALVTSLNVAAHRLETLVSDRRAALAAQSIEPRPRARSS